MRILANIEFYNSPTGEVHCKPSGEAFFILSEKHTDIIDQLLSAINNRYPEAFSALSEKYSRYSRNKLHYEFIMAHRFVRCNFGEYDSSKQDVDDNGEFNFEEVKCPLRGECRYEGVICKPKLNTILTDREREILKMIANGLQTQDIANKLLLSIYTVNRHRENMKAKLGLHSVSQLTSYYYNNFKD